MKKSSNILIVDDTPENLTVLRQILAEEAYRVRPAISGEIALKAVEAELPDMILLDIVMPNMSGYEVCRKLKKNEATRNIPVIFISALHEVADKVKAFDEGGVDYITKPFQAAEVLARVKTHISLHFLQEALKKKNIALQKSLDEVQQLKGLLPICTCCKSVRDDNGYWESIEIYVSNNSEATFSDSICPDCGAKSDEKYAKVNLPEKKRLAYAKRLDDYMVKEKAFLAESISVRQVSDALDIAPHHISMTINIECRQNFYNYVNSYRIKFAEELLRDPEEKDEQIIGIAYRSGFQSKTSFNKVFKALNNMTPTQYRKEHAS
jgi:CheY-like chemotaxis protein/AraC-like DNA-binding protein